MRERNTKKEELIEKNLVTLIEDEEKYYGASITVSITIASLLTITSACTSSCWKPGKN